MSVPDHLEPRFHPPEKWVGDFFHCDDTGHQIYYGYALADNPKGVVILQGGLSEFSEKHYETAHDLLARGFSVFTMDWYAQGRSTRPLANPQKRHSEGFEQDVADLDCFITHCVKPQIGDLPLIILAHSMGCNMAMRYAISYPDTFSAMVLLSPLFGIQALKHFPVPLICLLLFVLKPLYRCYIAGGDNWHEDVRTEGGHDIFSSDPVRKEVHNIWCLQNPELQVGSPTFGWVNAAWRSCRYIQNYDFSSFTTPCLFLTAEDEHLVDNAVTQDIAPQLPDAHIREMQDSKHEILMERDEIRNRMWQEFDKFLEQRGLLG